MSLQGKRVLVTRAAEEAGELEALLRGRGAAPVRFPCIAFVDGPDVDRIVEATRKGPDFIVVSSPQAARRLVDLIGRTSPTALPTAASLIGRTSAPRFAAVGAATAALLPGDVIVPRSGTGAEALLAVLAPLVRGKRVLVPRAEAGTPALTDGLAAAGADVEALTLYRTVTPAAADLGALDGIDAISFASGSAVRGFVKLAGAPRANAAVTAAIGASTAAEAEKAGIRIDAYGGEGLAALCDALALAVSARKG
ncbi:MAG TPA: uroporphyrinogen-III synthase [Myxococcales bacterium]|nr:uroporphyrinogen-III synthase [Myxococcales bacterium]